MATLLSDNFDRANSTTVLGSPQVGPAPSIVQGTAGIISNLAYFPVAAGIAVYNLGTPDVELSIDYSALSGSNGAGLVIGYTSMTDHHIVIYYSDRIELYRQTIGGLALQASSYAKPPTATGSGKAHYKDGIIRAYVNGVLAMRYVPEVPITAINHGIRSGGTAARFDNLLGVDAPTITEPILNGARPDAAFVYKAATPTASPSFAYLGRDTKLQDISEGA